MEDNSDNVEQILKDLNSTSWMELMTALNQAKGLLQTVSPGDACARQLTNRIIGFSNHAKWEVRKSAAEALCYGVGPAAMEALRRLEDDSVPYVRQAAQKSLRESKRGATKVYEKRDPTSERLFSLIKKMNPRNIREAYASAMQVGQIYYRELAGVTTHELRNNLRIISDQLDAIEDSLNLYPNPVAAGPIDKAKQNMQELIEVIDRLAFLSRDPGPVEVFEVARVLEEAMQEARSKVRQDGHNCEDVRGIWHRDDVKLKGDKLQFKIALRNLIMNAIEASPADQIVDVTLEVSGGFLTICIQDRGRGMTEQEITSAFKLFTSSKKKPDGMGLGVPIAQKVIHFDFTGEIRYESELDKGTRVFVRLPIYTEDAP